MPLNFKEWAGDAMIVGNGVFRPLLERWRYDQRVPYVLFCMLNPSTATATTNDATIRRCISYANDWGYTRLKVVNVWDYRATDVKELAQRIRREGDFSSPLSLVCDRIMRQAARNANKIVAAWGSIETKVPPCGWPRVLEVVELLRRHGDVYCIDKTKRGQPVHPLMQRADLKPKLLWSKLK